MNKPRLYKTAGKDCRFKINNETRLLAVDQEYIDNDNRPAGRRVKIIEIDTRYARVENIKTGHKTRVLIHKFHTDGKARKTGYSLVEMNNE